MAKDHKPLPHNGTERSKEAARLMAPTATEVRALVYRLIREAGKRGMTDQELYQATPRRFSESTVRPRRYELVQDGLVKDSGETRPTRRNFQATVWVAAEVR